MRKPTFWFPNRSDTNRAAWPKKMARGLKFRLCDVEELYFPIVAKTKALISFAATAKLICVFVFAYAKRWLSHGAAQMYFTKSRHEYFSQSELSVLAKHYPANKLLFVSMDGKYLGCSLATFQSKYA